MGFIDLHSHILPGLDDGAGDIRASKDMIAGLAALGFETICATPHQKAGQFMPSGEAIRTAHQTIVTEAASMGLTLSIPLAAENMWDPVFFERMQSKRIPSYDDGDVFLFELPISALPVGLLDHLFQLRMTGTLPVMAHPERYQPLWKDRDTLHQLAEQCAMVVDLGAVAGYHGRKQAKAARKMLQQGIAHAAASDSHSPTDVRVAAEGIAWIRKKLGEAAVTRLLDENPRRILAGDHPGGG